MITIFSWKRLKRHHRLGFYFSDRSNLLVYPDGVWYRQATPEVIERILQEHIIGNQIVEDYAFLRHPLPSLPDQ